MLAAALFLYSCSSWREKISGWWSFPSTDLNVWNNREVLFLGSRSRNEWSKPIRVKRLLIECEVRCAIWYHLYNLKNLKSTHGGVLILVKLQGETCNFTKINTPSWVFFRFFKLYKWYQIPQRTTCEFKLRSVKD